MSKLHVIYGTGNVGKAVMQALLDRGQRVRVVNRSGLADAPASVEQMRGDVLDTDFARRAAEGADVIYATLNAPYHKWAEVFPKLQAAVVDAARSAGARLVVLDNLYMYGDPQGKPLTEETPYSAHTRKGKVRAQMARDLMAAHARGDVEVAVGRASDYWGPGVQQSMITGDMGAFTSMLKGKTGAVLGDPDARHTYSYVPDVARGLVNLAEHDRAFGQIWHLPTAPTGTTRQLLERLAAAAGVEPKISVPPRFILRLMGLFNPGLRELLEMLYGFDHDFIMDHSKFVAAFGDLSTPLDVAVRETVAAERARVRGEA